MDIFICERGAETHIEMAIEFEPKKGVVNFVPISSLSSSSAVAVAVVVATCLVLQVIEQADPLRNQYW